MYIPESPYDLMQVDNVLCATKRRDDVPFDEAVQYQIEPATTNYFPYQPQGEWIGTTSDTFRAVYIPEFKDYALRIKYIAEQTSRSWNIGTLGTGIFAPGNLLTFSVYQKADGTAQAIKAVLYNVTRNAVYKDLTVSTVTDEFARYEKTITVTNDATHQAGDTIAVVLYGPNGSGMQDGYNYYLMPQLELGNVATSFQPIPRQDGMLTLPPTQIRRSNFAVGQWFKIKALTQNDTVLIDKTPASDMGVRVYVTNSGVLTLKVGDQTVTDSQLIGQDWFFLLLYGTDNAVGLKIRDNLGLRKIQISQKAPVDCEEALLSIGNTSNCDMPGYVLVSELVVGEFLDENGVSAWSDDYIDKIFTLKRPFDTSTKARVIPYHQHDSRYLRHYNNSVGIKTSSPEYDLDVNGTARIKTGLINKLQAGTETPSSAVVTVLETTDSDAMKIESEETSNQLTLSVRNTTQLKSQQSISINVAGNTLIHVTNTAVGIGAQPTSRLTISGGSLALPAVDYEGQGQIQCSDTVKFADKTQAQGIYVKEIQVTNSWADADANKQVNGLYVKGNVRINDKFFVNADIGYVGINTTSPTSHLHVNGSAVITGTLNISDEIGISGNLIIKDSSNSTVLTVMTGTKRVGINTSSPATALHVNGNIRGNQNGAVRISTGNGYVDVGPKNNAQQHFDTDRAYYLFNKPVYASMKLQLTNTGYNISTTSFQLPGGTVNGSLGVTSYIDTPKIQNADGNLEFQANGHSCIFKSDGKVGILTSSPSEQIHLNGNVRGGRTGGVLRIQTSYGYIDVGPNSSSQQQLTTDRAQFTFNKKLVAPEFVISGGSYYINSSGGFKLNNGTISSATITTLSVTTINGSKLTLSGNQNVSGYVNATSYVKGTQFQSTASSGTSPLTVKSTTKVVNLNADLLDGAHASASNSSSTIVLRDSSGNINANGVYGKTFGTTNTSAVYLKSNNATRIYLSNTGQVGIRTVSPKQDIHLQGNVCGSQAGNALKVKTSYGYVDVGPQNTSWCHFTTDRPKFYFNKSADVNGRIGIYNTSYGFDSSSATFNALTQNGSLKVIGSSDEKIILQNSSNPYIRFRESTTNKQYIQWNSGGYLYLRNQEDGSGLRIRDEMDFTKNGSTFYKVWHAGNDGADSGLDADTVDGLHADELRLKAVNFLHAEPTLKLITTFGNLSSNYQWRGGVLAPNGKIYSLPLLNAYGLEIDPETHSVSNFPVGGAFWSGKYNWSGSVLALNGKIYGIPHDAYHVVELDPSTHDTSLLGIYTDEKKWAGGVLAPNGKIYGIPYNQSSILEIDPTQSTTTFENLSGTYKWCGGVLAPNGKIYCIPFYSTQILEIDPDTRDVTLFGNISGYRKWAGGVLAPNGKIYAIPYDCPWVLEIDPETRSTTTFGAIYGNGKWFGGALAFNGKIYGIPYNSEVFLEIDPNERKMTTFGTCSSSTNKWAGGVLAPNGNIYGIPQNQTQILEIQLLSYYGPYINKY